MKNFRIDDIMSGPFGDYAPVAPANSAVVTLTDETEVAEGEFLRVRYNLNEYQVKDVTNYLRFAQEFATASRTGESPEAVLARKDARDAVRSLEHLDRIEEIETEIENEEQDLYSTLAAIFGPGVQFAPAPQNLRNLELVD